jgi:NAD(P)H-hydrate epimerase
MNRVTELVNLRPRENSGYKNRYGRCLVIAGSMRMPGAAVLAGKAALRGGAGLVEMIVPQCVHGIIAAQEPCYMVTPAAGDELGRLSIDSLDDILASAEHADVIAIGPGLGVSDALQQLLCELIAVPQFNLVIDADALNNLTARPNWPSSAEANIILTPHPGEMKRLSRSLNLETNPAERAKSAIELSLVSGAIVVLKGAGTVVSLGEDCYINNTGNPGMATGGSGDVLTGLIAAIWAQMINESPSEDQLKRAFDASSLSSYLHGLAGNIARERRGCISMTATDIIECLGEAFSTAGM